MHGYDYPWPGGGGKNLFGCADGTYAVGTTRVINVNNQVWEYVVNRSAGSYVFLPEATIGVMGIKKLQPGTYTFSVTTNALDSAFIASTVLSLSDGQTVTNGNSFTVSEETSIISITTLNQHSYVTGTYSCDIQIELGSTATAWAPYSNECPISGYTGTEIYHGAEYDADADPAITVTFPETIYGGEDEVITGKLKSTMGIVDLGTLKWSYNGAVFSAAVSGIFIPIVAAERAKGIISSAYPVSTILNIGNTMDDKSMLTRSGNVYIRDTSYTDAESFKTAMSGVQLCYELAEPVEYTLAENEMLALDGTNVIWANTGDVAVTYIAKSAKFSFGSPLHTYNYNNLKLFGNTYIEHGKG